MLWGLSSEAWTAVFTATLTGSTIGLWVVTWLTLRHARDSSERQLRAYIGITLAKFEEIGKPRLRLHVHNTGVTPGSHVDCRAVLHFESGAGVDLPAGFQFDEALALNRAPFPLLGGESRGTSFPIESGLESLHTGAQTLFVFVRAIYIDAFGGNRFTTECFRCISRDGGKTLLFETYGDYAKAS